LIENKFEKLSELVENRLQLNNLIIIDL